MQGSLLAARGVHTRMALYLMRHSQFSLTMEVYTHIAPEMAREPISNVKRAWTGIRRVVELGCTLPAA